MKSAFLALALLAAPAAALAQAAPDTNPANARGGNFTVESSHTRVLFAVSHMGFTTWYGNFTGVTGSLTLDPKDIAASKFDIMIPANSVTTTNAKVDSELNSPEWFDTAKYPTIEFKSEKVVRTGHDTAQVTGALTFHGVTRPETLNVTFNAAGMNNFTKQYTVGFNATGALKRSDFNQSTYVPLIGDDVTLIISAAFVQP
jgi:polyisoprenoid-binding protein YceI